MLILKKDIVPGMVVWGEKNVYYDQPDRSIEDKKCMYVVTMVNDDYFLGCSLTTQACKKNSTILSKKHYPIRNDSRVRETLYKVYYDQIVNSRSFKLDPNTFEYFKRNLYKRIMLGNADSPSEYNEAFVSEYVKEHVPSVDSIVMYTAPEKKYKYYYAYSENEADFICVPLNRENINENIVYSVMSDEFVTIPKTVRYFDFFTNHTLSREEVEQEVQSVNKQKKIGSYFQDLFKLKK